jgi:hypothetical protein
MAKPSTSLRQTWFKGLTTHSPFLKTLVEMYLFYLDLNAM